MEKLGHSVFQSDGLIYEWNIIYAWTWTWSGNLRAKKEKKPTGGTRGWCSFTQPIPGQNSRDLFTWNLEISFWTSWIRRICRMRESRLWCRREGWWRSWWGVVGWWLKPTRCSTARLCCFSGPVPEQTPTGSPDFHFPSEHQEDMWKEEVPSRTLNVPLAAPLPTCFLKLSLSLSREGGWRLDFWASWALAIWALQSRRPVWGTGIFQSGPDDKHFQLYLHTLAF